MTGMVSKKLSIDSGNTSGLKWSMASLTKAGEQKCGDTYLVKRYRDKALLAAIDGLGHGESAFRASQKAKYLLDTFSNESIINLVHHCHKELKNTRGVVMNLALIDSWEKTLTWLGVGNVSGILLSMNERGDCDTESVISKHGIVGYNMPSLQASIVPIADGDILIFTTDGVQEYYQEKINTENSTEEIVEFIANNYFKHTDDALILAARFTGEENNG